MLSSHGPALTVALAVFVIGTLWRLVGVLRLPRRPDLSPAREGAPSALAAAWHANLRAMCAIRVRAPPRTSSLNATRSTSASR
ncbi:MAG: hypothetical protein IPF73_14790 [Betaproteobacteria bacterium]|nr:hypothetical protein [Betaproteobacteria bacterium]